jgi:hypothetical protein
MARVPVRFLSSNSDNEIEDSDKISQHQLDGAKIFSCREEYVKTLPQGIRFLEMGVAWGYSVKLVIEAARPSKVDLLDWYNQDLKCWSWRKFGSCQCQGFKHELLYTPEEHQDYIINLFSDYPNVTTYKGDTSNVLPKLLDAGNEYDYIYIDITNERGKTKQALAFASQMVPVGGIIGMNDYLIYDGIIEDQPYGTFQTVNEFLSNNHNWVVDAIALHNLGFYDIYLKRVS